MTRVDVVTVLADLVPAVSEPRWPVTGAPLMEAQTLHPVRSNLFAPVAEAALHPRLRDLASRLPGAYRGVLVCAEFRSPVGVPDLVALVPDVDAVAARLASDIPALLSEHDCRAVSAADGTRDVLGVVAAAELSLDAGVRRVRRLVGMGALVVGKSGGVVAAPALRPMGRLWALEAKVSDWRGGLRQAARYQLWADGAVLVLGRSSVSDGVLAVEAGYRGVGVNVDGRWVRRPRLADTALAWRLWGSEHMVAAVRGR